MTSLRMRQGERGAIFIPGPTVTAISGQVADTVFSENLGGAYVRTLTKPFNPRTPEQMEVRGLMSSYAQSWDSALNDSQRAAWEQWAKTHKLKNRLGKDTELTAIAWFCRISFNRVWYSGGADTSLYADPPQNQQVFPCNKFAESPVPAVVATTGVITATLSPNPAPAVDSYWTLMVSARMAQGATRPAPTTYLLSDDAATPFTGVYPSARYGTLTAGDRITIRACICNVVNGAVTIPIEAIVTAS